MKTKHWMFAAALLAGLAVPPALSGQPASSPTPSAPATGEAPALIPAEALTPGATDKSKKNAAKPAAEKKAAKKTAKKTTAPGDSQEASSFIHPGPAVVKQNNVNVRGQAAISSEVLVRLKRGDQVTVLEEVTLKKPHEDEPAHWARVALPTNVAIWVHAMFIDADSKTVKPKRLNLRSGPGENYSVLGHVEKGAPVQEIESKGEWIRIEPPNSAFGFVAAHLLTNIAPSLLIANNPPPQPVPKPVETVLPAEQVITPPTAVAPPDPAAPTPPAVTETKAEELKPPPLFIETPPPAPVIEEPPPKRIVSREGYVRDTISIQAPTYFRLESLDTHKTINYLYAPDTNVVLRGFNGKRIVVTGEELLDERWPHTPVITVDTIKEAP
jgi:SH3-like domain-containing protein